MKIEKPEDFCIKVNLLANRYTTDGVIWTVDETVFNNETKLFLVISLNTRAILGYIQGKNCRNDNLIIELYTQILDEYNFSSKPCFIHSDMEVTYHSENVQEFLKQEGIYLSVTEGYSNQNQLSESINSRIKYLVTEIMVENSNSRGYREFYKTLPEKLRCLYKKDHKCRDKEYRKHLFESKFFKNERQVIIEKAIIKYNQTNFTEGVTRQQAQYYDSFIEGRNIDNTRLLKSSDIFSQMVEEDNISSIKEVKTKICDILQTKLKSEDKIAEIVSIVAQRQDSSTEVMKKGFIGLSIQNAQLQEKLDKIQKELETVTEELQEKTKQEQLILEKRQQRKLRKRLPPKDPVNEEIYEYLIETANKRYRETYYGARLRLALTLLVITGVRVSELLPLRIDQVESLFAKGWIAIDRTKRGPSSHKAFLTPKGVKILKKRAKDFEIVSYSKENDYYVFTQQYVYEPLTRQSFTRFINEFLKNTVSKLPNQPNITSHSFRVGFITQLWKDTNDIEFVRQAIGHAKIDTTSRYVQNLSAEERQKRMIDIQTEDDLFY